MFLSKEPAGVINLHEITRVAADFPGAGASDFVLVTPGARLRLNAGKPADRDEWVRVLQTKIPPNTDSLRLAVGLGGSEGVRIVSYKSSTPTRAPVPAPSPSPNREGTLARKGDVWPYNYSARFFVLSDDKLERFARRGSASKGALVFSAGACSVRWAAEANTFIVVCDGKETKLKAASEAERAKWVTDIKQRMAERAKWVTERAKWMEAPAAAAAAAAAAARDAAAADALCARRLARPPWQTPLRRSPSRWAARTCGPSAGCAGSSP
jgi:hypothetical protein